MIFACTYIRVWSIQAQAAGNVLVVVVCIALDRALTPEQAGLTAVMFAAGGLWATFLALVIWRLHPYRPAHRAVADVWRGLARLVGDLERLAACRSRRPRRSTAIPAPTAGACARGSRPPRTMILDLARSRERVSERTAQALLRLESAEQIFSNLIAVTELLDSGPRRSSARRPSASCGACAPPRGDRPRDPRRRQPRPRAARTGPGRATEGLAAEPTLARLAERIVGRVRIGAKLSTPEGYRPGGLDEGGRLGWRARTLDPLVQNFTTSSPNLRHAVRATAVAAPALAARSATAAPSPIGSSSPWC